MTMKFFIVQDIDKTGKQRKLDEYSQLSRMRTPSGIEKSVR